jgi:hypothetical protein
MVRTAVESDQSKKTWVRPELKRLVAGKAEDNAGVGADLNGRLS